MIHLDTSFLTHALVPDSTADKQLREWLVRGIPLGVSTIVWTEFLCGPVEEHEIDSRYESFPNRCHLRRRMRSCRRAFSILEGVAAVH